MGGRAALVSHLAVLAVAFSLFAFSKSIADDFCRANMADEVFVSLQQDYVNWSGRWLAHGLEVVLLSSWDPTVSYPALAGSIALLHLLSIYVFVRAFIGGEVRRATTLGFAVSYFVLFWSMHPAPGQSFYWFTGSVEYQLSLSLTLLLLALLSQRPAAPAPWQRFLKSAVAPAIGFLIAGIHELVSCMLAVVCLVGAVVTRKTGRLNRRLWAWVAVFSLLGLLLVASAPGNQARRMASFPDSYDLLLTLWLTLWQAVKSVTRWICDVKLLSATMLFILHPAIHWSRPDWLLHGRISLRWIILGTWVLLLAIGFGAPSWVTGQEMAGRTLSAVYYVFLLGWFVNVFVFTRTLDLGSIVAKEHLPSIRSFILGNSEFLVGRDEAVRCA